MDYFLDSDESDYDIIEESHAYGYKDTTLDILSELVKEFIRFVALGTGKYC